MPKSDRCPLCKANSHMVDSVSLVFSLGEWPVALIFAGSILIYAGVTELSGFDALLFVLLAILPLGFKTLRKKSCLHCRIEFTPEEADRPEHHTLGV